MNKHVKSAAEKCENVLEVRLESVLQETGQDGKRAVVRGERIFEENMIRGGSYVLIYFG